MVFVDISGSSKTNHPARFRKATDEQPERVTSSSELDSATEVFKSGLSADENNISRTSDDSPCPLLGYSTKIKSSVRGFMPFKNHALLSQKFVSRLVRRFPAGKVFSFQNDGTSWSSSGGEGASEETNSSSSSFVNAAAQGRTKKGRTRAKLALIFPDVRAVAFLPMWDPRREKWRGAAFVWSSVNNRFLDPQEDLTYLAAFSNSVLAELGRLDAIAADQAKATFIASVSHELRSPLHGILAGAELLEDSQLTPYQQEMARTISTAGNTLLDTVNHILDFTKINNFTDTQRHQRAEDDQARNEAFKAADIGEVGVTTAIDLAVLTEDVADTVVKAYQFDQTGPNPSSGVRSRSHQERVHVLLEIEKRPSWTVNVSAGSWTRILTNLLGNALKYTKHGSICVRLRSKTLRDKHQTAMIYLEIEDTGQGMSVEYLRHHLYMPFMQENSHAVGTGLGLSIVKQIVDDIKGRIDVQSESGRGTRIAVSLRSAFLPQQGKGPASVDAISRELGQDVKVSMISSQLLEKDRTDEDMARDLQEQAAKSSLSRTFSQWLDYECRFRSTPREASRG